MVSGSILLINFEGKDDFKIFNSYLRNKFINTKIDGKISFTDPFNFDLNLDVNQINLKIIKNGWSGRKALRKG